MDIQKTLQLANSGNANAQNSLGVAYFTGDGVVKDYNKAAYWIEKAANQGLAMGQRNLGTLYAEGKGVPKNIEKAIHWYKKAAQQNDYYSQRQLGYAYENGLLGTRDYKEAVRWYGSAAVGNNARAQHDLGRCYLNGLGVAKDVNKAFSWFQKAAMAKIPEAQAELGVCFCNGIGVEQDYKRGAYWLGEAAKLGNVVAQNDLGFLCEKGLGVFQNMVNAKYWYEQSANRGYKNAQHSLAVCYRDGKGTAADEEKALYWFEKAAQNGYVLAMNEAGVLHYNRDKYMKAFEWWELANKNGNTDATNNLGVIYENGLGVEVDEEIALTYYEAAAEMGHEIARENAERLRQEINMQNNRVKFTTEFAEQKRVEEIKEDIPQEKKKNPIDELNELIGLNDLKLEVQKVLSSAKVQKMREERGLKTVPISRHMVFTGNPGTGKTTVARIIADVYKELGILPKGQLVEVKRDDLVGQYIGQTSKLTNAKIEEAMGGVLFVDEAYTLVKEGNDFGQEAIDTLLVAMENHRDDFIVIVAGYENKMDGFINSNPGLKSRFKTYLNFPDYDGTELFEIFKMLCQKYEFVLGKGVEEALQNHFEAYVLQKGDNFANARDVRNCFEMAMVNMDARVGMMSNPSVEDFTTFKVEDFEGLILVEDGNHVSENSALEQLNQLIGLASLKEDVKALIEMEKIKKLRATMGLMDASDAHHMIFTGNPGTGKTTVARIIGDVYKEIGILSKGHLVEVKREDLVAGYVGQTAQRTAEKIKEAMGGVLFIDEAYTLVKDSQQDFGQEAIDTLLAEMENHRNDFVVIAAGYPNEMNHFVNSNPGLKSRFNNYLHFPDYNAEDMVQIFEMFCKKNHYTIDDEVKMVVLDYFINLEMNKDANFANAREVRNYFEKVKMQFARRLNMINNPTMEDLMKITVDDVINIF